MDIIKYIKKRKLIKNIKDAINYFWINSMFFIEVLWRI